MYKIGDTFEYNNGRGEVVYYIVKRVQPHAMSEMRYACDCIKDGVSLSAYQGKVLQDKINQSTKDKKDWKKVMEGRYTTVYYNSAIKLCQCIYNRDSYTGFKTKANETIVIHAENTIPAAYQPPGRCSVPLYDGDVTVYVRPNGSICARSLKKIDEIHLNCSWMWAVI